MIYYVAYIQYNIHYKINYYQQMTVDHELSLDIYNIQLKHKHIYLLLAGTLPGRGRRDGWEESEVLGSSRGRLGLVESWGCPISDCIRFCPVFTVEALLPVMLPDCNKIIQRLRNDTLRLWLSVFLLYRKHGTLTAEHLKGNMKETITVNSTCQYSWVTFGVNFTIIFGMPLS